jgi:hypothetical protein
MATLVIYREWGYRGSFFDNGFFVNGEVAASLPTRTYTFVAVKPGNVGVSWATTANEKPTDRSKPVVINAQAGEIYFFKKGTSTTGIIPLPFVVVSTAKSEWGFIEKNAAREELKTYKFVKPTKEAF